MLKKQAYMSTQLISAVTSFVERALDLIFSKPLATILKILFVVMDTDLKNNCQIVVRSLENIKTGLHYKIFLHC